MTFLLWFVLLSNFLHPHYWPNTLTSFLPFIKEFLVCRATWLTHIPWDTYHNVNPSEWRKVWVYQETISWYHFFFCQWAIRCRSSKSSWVPRGLQSLQPERKERLITILLKVENSRWNLGTCWLYSCCILSSEECCWGSRSNRQVEIEVKLLRLLSFGWVWGYFIVWAGLESMY